VPATTALTRPWSRPLRECFLFLRQNHLQTCSAAQHGPLQQKDHRTSLISKTPDHLTPERPRTTCLRRARPPPEEPELWSRARLPKPLGMSQELLRWSRQEDKPCPGPTRVDPAVLRCHIHHNCPTWTSEVTHLPSGLDLKCPLPWLEWTLAFSWTPTPAPSLLRFTGLATPSTWASMVMAPTTFRTSALFTWFRPRCRLDRM
jgi:hypothetical protein